MSLRSWKFSLDDNPALDPEYVAWLKATHVGLWFRRFILGDWRFAEGAVYDMFDDTRHVVDILPPMSDWLCVSVDDGTTNPLHALLIGLGVDGTLYVVAEWRCGFAAAGTADDRRRIQPGAAGLAQHRPPASVEPART